MEQLLIIAALFLLGSFFGSFASAITHRLHNNDASFWYGRSKCVHCEKTLQWYNLIPIFSYLKQGGKSQCCHKPISSWYLASELIAGLLFILPYYAWTTNQLPILNAGTTKLYLVLLFVVLFIIHLIVVYDAKYKLIPDLYSYGLITVSAVIGYLNLEISWRNQLVAAAVGGGFFLAQYLVSRGRWIGSGDIFLGLAMGLLLGIKGVLVALFLAYVAGSVIGVTLLISKKADRKTALPFGPFLMLGTVISLFWGTQIANWYLQLITI